MHTYKVEGGHMLSGTIAVSGSKNSALPIICASLINNGFAHLENIPSIVDIVKLRTILAYLNVFSYYEDDRLFIDTRKLKIAPLTITEISDFRASYYLMGALIPQKNLLIVKSPGGCNLGARPIDLHLFAFEALGITYTTAEDSYVFDNKNFHAGTIVFPSVSMGATVNAILLASQLPEVTRIENYSHEPEIIDLIEFLKKSGINIVATDDYLLINKKSAVTSVTHKIIYDRIEAGTYLILGALIGDKLKIKNFDPALNKSLLSLLSDGGIFFNLEKNIVTVSQQTITNNLVISSGPYPEFPTDLVSLIIVLLSRGEHIHKITETVYGGRFSVVDELKKQGANIARFDNSIIIKGIENLVPAELIGKDLRQAMALIISALATDGCIIIKNVDYALRGYENIITKLCRIGATIEEIKNEE